MDENLSSFKSLEEVRLKATYNIEINGRSFDEGETIVMFDKIQVAGLQEVKEYIAARGGYGNPGHVFWNKTKELSLNFSQGVFSNTQFALLNNARVIKVSENDPILISTTVEATSNEYGILNLNPTPVDQLFIYNADTGEKLTWEKANYGIIIQQTNQDIIAHYRYNYMGGGSIAKIGQTALDGYLELEGKTRIKEDNDGRVTTGIIKIPKLKLMSGLSIRLGAQSNPVVGSFSAVAMPTEMRLNSYVLEFDFLEDDIDSDM